MTRTLPFNAATVDAAKAVGGKATEYRIDRVSGLALLVQPSGTGTFYLVYSVGSARRRLKLGRRGTMTLGAAKIAAIEALATVAKGSDPVADANAMRLAMTVSELVDAFLDADDGPAASTRAAYRAALGKDITPTDGTGLGSVPVVELTANMIADVLDAVVARGSIVQADRTKAALSSAIAWGIKSRRAIGLQANVCRMLPARASARPRSRGMADTELAMLWSALDKVTEPVALCARLAWITASRRSEVVGARRRELDLENARWTIPGDTMVKGRLVEGRTKSGTDKTVPLSTEAVALFRRAIELAGGNCDHIFPAQRQGERFPHLDPHSVTRAVARLRGAATDVRLHDGRAACRTWLRDAGYPDTILDAALGHAGGSVGKRHYEAPTLAFIEKQMRPALQAWSDHVASVVGMASTGEKAASNVVALRA